MSGVGNVLRLRCAACFPIASFMPAIECHQRDACLLHADGEAHAGAAPAAGAAKKPTRHAKTRSCAAAAAVRNARTGDSVPSRPGVASASDESLRGRGL